MDLPEDLDYDVDWQPELPQELPANGNHLEFLQPGYVAPPPTPPTHDMIDDGDEDVDAAEHFLDALLDMEDLGMAVQPAAMHQPLPELANCQNANCEAIPFFPRSGGLLSTMSCTA